MLYLSTYSYKRMHLLTRFYSITISAILKFGHGSWDKATYKIGMGNYSINHEIVIIRLAVIVSSSFFCPSIIKNGNYRVLEMKVQIA